MVNDRECIDWNKLYVNTVSGAKKYGDDLYYDDEDGLVILDQWVMFEEDD